MQILKNLYQVSGSLNGITWDETDASYQDCNTYIWKTTQGLIMFDCGCGDTFDQIIRNMAYWHLDLKDVKACFVTHAHLDHAGAAHKLEAMNIPVFAHREAAKSMKAADERCCGYLYHKKFTVCHSVQVVEHDQKIDICGISIKALHFPGHTAGCTAFVFNHDNRQIVVSGDIIGTLLDGYFGWSGSFDFSKPDYLQSLIRMARYDFDIMLPGHGMVYFDRPRRRIENAMNEALIQWR